MTINVIPSGFSQIHSYTKSVLEFNDGYTPEDREWLAHIILNICEYMNSNIYYILSLINMKNFSGYFCRSYNDMLLKGVKNKDNDSVLELLTAPIYPEIYDNNNLNTEEKQILINLLHLDILTTNLTIKRICINPILNSNITKTYEESYSNIYYNLYQSKFDYHKIDFNDFVILMEENETTRIKYARTFGLFDLLTQYIYDSLPKEIGEKNIKSIKDKYYLEIKMVYHYLEYKHN
jgi:hypothetical protein